MYRSIPIFVVAFAAAFAQSPQPAFEVASVKPSTPQSVRMFDGMMAGGTVRNPGMISYTRATLDDLLYRAYNLADFEQISGPAWLGTEPYDIYAKIPPGTTSEQFRAMMRGLLEERFKLLEFSTRGLTTDDDPLPSLFDALQQQLGLKLEDTKAPFDVVVVDHAEKVPTAN